MSHDPCVAWVGYFDTWTKDDPTLEKFWVAVVGFHRWTCARAMLRLEVLMSLRDVWGALNSRRPPFGSLVGHTDCPPGGASLQATLEVIAGLLELSAPQTSPRRHLPPTENAPRTHGLQYFFFQTPRFSTSQAVQSKNTYRWTVLTHWLLHLRVFYHFSRRYWPMDCCFFTGSRFSEGGYKALKSRVVHVKYEKKGVTLLWI